MSEYIQTLDGPILLLKSRRPDFRCVYQANTYGERNFHHSVVVPEVRSALADFIRGAPADTYVIVGGIAVSHWTRPRSTMDVDVLLMSKDGLVVDGFKKAREHALVHRDTHVEVETLTPSFIRTDEQRAAKIFETAVGIGDGAKVASPQALVVMKLKRLSHQDKADIDSLVKEFGKPDPHFWGLSHEESLLLDQF